MLLGWWYTNATKDVRRSLAALQLSAALAADPAVQTTLSTKPR
jgi:hypothetical protein